MGHDCLSGCAGMMKNTGDSQLNCGSGTLLELPLKTASLKTQARALFFSTTTKIAKNFSLRFLSLNSNINTSGFAKREFLAFLSFRNNHVFYSC